MKLLALTALLSSAASQDTTFCTEDAGVCEGKVKEGGCCNIWEAVSWNDDSEWGDFANVWDYSTAGKLEKGSYWGACMEPEYVTASANANGDEGVVNNFDDLSLIKMVDPDTNAFGDVNEWIDAWGSNEETQKGFNMKVYCKNAVSLAASAMVAASALAAL